MPGEKAIRNRSCSVQPARAFSGPFGWMKSQDGTGEEACDSWKQAAAGVTLCHKPQPPVFMRAILAFVRARRAFRSCLRTPSAEDIKASDNQKPTVDEFCRNALVPAPEQNA